MQEYVVLFPYELYFCFPDGAFPCQGVKRHIAVVYGIGALLQASARNAPYAGGKFRKVDRLGDLAVGAEVAAFQFVFQ